MDYVPDNLVYAGNVSEFVKVAGEFCNLAEGSGGEDKKTLVANLREIVARLYYLAQTLPAVEPVLEDALQQYVVEEDYDKVKNGLKQKLGPADDYPEVFDPVRQETEGAISASLSENVADIYQSLTDFILNYSNGTNEIMNDAIWYCKQDFEEHWGQKSVNALRAMHNLLNNEEQLLAEADGEEELNPTDPDEEMKNVDTSSWIFSKVQKRYKNDE